MMKMISQEVLHLFKIKNKKKMQKNYLMNYLVVLKMKLKEA